MKTYYFSKKLSVTDTQVKYALPRLRAINIINYGDYPVFVEFEGEVNDDSVPIPVGASINVPSDMLYMNYKTLAETSTLYMFGLKHEKS